MAKRKPLVVHLSSSSAYSLSSSLVSQFLSVLVSSGVMTVARRPCGVISNTLAAPISPFVRTVSALAGSLPFRVFRVFSARGAALPAVVFAPLVELLQHQEESRRGG